VEERRDSHDIYKRSERGYVRAWRSLGVYKYEYMLMQRRANNVRCIRTHVIRVIINNCNTVS
jgi:hypothetical protein